MLEPFGLSHFCVSMMLANYKTYVNALPRKSDGIMVIMNPVRTPGEKIMHKTTFFVIESISNTDFNFGLEL